MRFSMLSGQVNWVVEDSRFHRVLTYIDDHFPTFWVASWFSRGQQASNVYHHFELGRLSFVARFVCKFQQCRACDFAATNLPRIQSFNRQAAKISPWWFWTKLWWHWFGQTDKHLPAFEIPIRIAIGSKHLLWHFSCPPCGPKRGVSLPAWRITALQSLCALSKESASCFAAYWNAPGGAYPGRWTVNSVR